MASSKDAQKWREYLLASPVARLVFEGISKIVRDRIDRYLIERNGPPMLTQNDEDWLIATCRTAAQTVVSNNDIEIDEELLKDITTQVMIDNHPLGPLMPLLKDPSVQNIHINGPHDCYVFADGERFYVPLSFQSSEDVMSRLVEYANMQAGERSIPISNAHPIGTLVLPTGERFHVASQVADPNPLITLRKHQPDRFANFSRLAEVGGMPPYMVKFLEASVTAKLNILFAGGVNTGKTTYLRAFGATVPDDERLGVIEDDKELKLLALRPDTDTFELTARPPNTEGLGGIGMDYLIREALRMNPNRVIVGEVRGKEALYMLKAMSSGWPGSACTIHAEVAEDAIPQLIGYVFEHEDSPKSEEQVAKRVARSIQLIVFLRSIRISKGKFRRVLDEVVAVHGFAAGEVMMKPIIKYDEVYDDWFWITGRPNEIGNDDWQRRFRNVGIDLNDLIPQSVIDQGSKYSAGRDEEGF